MEMVALLVLRVVALLVRDSPACMVVLGVSRPRVVAITGALLGEAIC